MGLFSGLRSLFGRKDDEEDYYDDYPSEEEQTSVQNSYADDDGLEEVTAEDTGETEDERYYSNRDAPSSVLGEPTLLNVIGPAYWSTDDMMQDEFVMREQSKSKTYGIAAYVPPSGYPRKLDTSIFEDVLAQGNIDLTLDIVPRTRRETMQELSQMLNIIRSNAEYQAEQGQTYQQHENLAKYSDLDEMIDEIQFDENRMYDVSTSVIVYGSSDREVNSRFNQISDLLSNKGVSLTPYARRQKSGYMQTIPIGARMINLDDTYRNVDRKALSVMDIARNASGRFNGGIPFGTNRATPSQNTEFLNIFGTNSHRPINYNMGIVGESGGGKSTSNKIKMAREISLLGFEHRSIDPDGEYVMLAKKLHQLNLTITSDSGFVINPCAVSLIETPLEEETMSDENGNPLSDKEIEEAIIMSKDGRQIVSHDDGSKYVQKVNVSQMISNVDGFVNVVLQSNGNDSGMDVGELRRLEDATRAVVDELGITNDPNSLFEDRAGAIGGKIYDRLPKPEPTLSDIYQKLVEQNTDSAGDPDPKVLRLLDGLKPYLRTGSKPLFDGQTNFGKGRSATLNDYKYVNFNISQLDGSMRHVAYYVITQYLWERWIKNPAKAMEKKVLDADEILQFIDDPTMFSFFETIVRRDRKRNASLTWLTQDIERFQGNPQAKALVTNSEFMFVLATKPEHRDLMKDTVNLTDGALDILTQNPKPGEGVLIQEGEAVWLRTNPSEYEMEFAESNRAVERERKQKDILDRLSYAAD